MTALENIAEIQPLNSGIEMTEFDEEREVIERAKTDPSAFGILFDKYYSSIFSYILHRTANVHLTEDLVSETFFSALANLNKFKWMNVPFSAWLYKIATNKLNEHYRKRKSKLKVISDDPAENSETAAAQDEKGMWETENKLIKQKRFLLLHNALKKLDNKYQTVIILRYFEDAAIAEIAVILSKSEGTVKSLIHRGLKLLRKHLDPSIAEELDYE